MNTESNTGVAEAYVLNVGKQYQIKGIPLGTADLVNTANFTTADAVNQMNTGRLPLTTCLV